MRDDAVTPGHRQDGYRVDSDTTLKMLFRQDVLKWSFIR